MQHHLRRLVHLAFTFVATFGGGACSCNDRSLPGPTQTTFEPVAASAVAAVGFVPFDVDQQDLAGPNSHAANYGKTPEIVVVPGADYLDVVLRSTDETAGPRAFQLRISDTAGALALSRALEIPTLGLVLGFARAADGTFYYATGTYDDDVNASYPGVGRHRTNVVRVYHYDADGNVAFDVDLDVARAEAFPSSEPIVNPATASSARLAVAGNVVALVAGNNTEPDPNLNGTRHQKALSTYLDATTGAVLRASGIWMSHSFDQRYLVDGTDLLEVHLGDAYDRAINCSRIRAAVPSGPITGYQPKGDLGDNNTYTRLGNLVRVPGATGSPMLLLLATEHGDVTDARVNSSRDLALARLEGDALDTSFGSPLAVTSSGDPVTNHLLFLTDYEGTTAGTDHAERPKLVAIGANDFLVLWERWSYDRTANMQTFQGTYAMRIDGTGSVQAGATRVSDHHLPRGDDAFAYAGGAAWLTGDQTDRTLTLHLVSSALGITETVVP